MHKFTTGLLRIRDRTSREWLAAQLTNVSIVLYFIWIAMSSLAIDTGPRALLVVFCGVLLYALTQRGL